MKARIVTVAGALVALALPAGAEEKAAPDLSALRDTCYGGRGRPLAPEAIELRERQVAVALHAHDAERAHRLLRRILQGGGDERRFLSGYVAALQGLSDPAERKRVVACTELLRALPPATPADSGPPRQP